MNALSIIKIVLTGFSFLGGLTGLLGFAMLYALHNPFLHTFIYTIISVVADPYGLPRVSALIHVWIFIWGIILMINGLASMTALLYMKD